MSSEPCRICNGRGGDFPADGGPWLDCKNCNGTGMIQNKEIVIDCPKCGGSGLMIMNDKTIIERLGVGMEPCSNCQGSGKMIHVENGDGWVPVSNKCVPPRKEQRTLYQRVCPVCHGKGGDFPHDGTPWVDCNHCGGSGMVHSNTAVNISIEEFPSIEATANYDSVRTIYQRAVDLWGTPTQIHMAVEECAELIKALMKLDRNINGNGEDKVIEEIADVLIMMEQLKYIFGSDKVDSVMQRKLARLLQLIQFGEGTA